MGDDTVHPVVVKALFPVVSGNKLRIGDDTVHPVVVEGSRFANTDECHSPATPVLSGLEPASSGVCGGNEQSQPGSANDAESLPEQGQIPTDTELCIPEVVGNVSYNVLESLNDAREAPLLVQDEHNPENDAGEHNNSINTHPMITISKRGILKSKEQGECCDSDRSRVDVEACVVCLAKRIELLSTSVIFVKTAFGITDWANRTKSVNPSSYIKVGPAIVIIT
ncbi:hypothetical protein V6N13_109996 [Hibiscus sabdariffa]